MSRRGKVTKVNQDCASKESKILKFSRQKHHRRSNLIDTLFMYASSFPQKITVSTLWENHKCINDILMQLTAIESEMKVSLRNRTRESVAHLQCWAKENGVEMNNVQITEVLGFDYGLVATNDVTEGSIVVSVPKRLMITVDSIKDSPLETLYNEDVVLQQLPNVALAIFILVEKFRTDKPSFWLPYLQALPNTYTTCVYFTMDDLNELKGSPALEYSLKMCKNIARQYAYFWRIFQKNTDEASNILRDVFTFEQYRWAVSTIMTRQNYIPCADCIPVNVIIPVWDFCNHANNERRDDTEPSTTYDVENECCVCVAPKHFSKGEQISIFYGERCNADFLVHNGFVYPQNHHDVVKVKFGIAKSDSCSLRLALLNKLKLPPSGEYSIKADERDPIHCSVLAFVRIFKMSQGQLNEWLQRDDAADVLLSPVPSMGVDFDRSVLHYLQTRIVILLKAYPTTIKEDQELLARDDLSTTRRLVITHRMTEKNILNKAVDYCKLKILELDTSEIKVQ